LNKDYHDVNSVFNEIYATPGSINAFIKSKISSAKTTSEAATPTSLNYLLGKGYYFEDSADIVFASVDLFYRRNQISKNVDIGVDAGYFFIEKKNVNKYEGMRYGLSLFWENFTFRLGLNNYTDFSEIVPTIKYENSYKKHSYLLEYTRQNALFYTYALCPYEKKIIANHFSASDYVNLKNNTNLWMNLQMNMSSNNDTEFTGQFDWRFYQDTLFTQNFTYYLALEGWYTSHSKESLCFYSPSFSDSTLVRIDPQYIFSKYFGIKGKLGIGYSVTEETQPFKYGYSIFGNPTENLSYTAGCTHSNAAKLAAGTTYHYTECEVNLGYKW